MVMENYYDLCTQMADMGYVCRHLVRDLRMYMDLGPDKIILIANNGLGLIPMMEDWLDYRLVFNKNGDYYSWDIAQVSLHRNLPIQHTVIDHIDTFELERRMKPINWRIDYADAIALSNLTPVQRSQDMPKALAIMEDMSKLMHSGSERGLHIALQLQQRYWLQGRRGSRQRLMANLIEHMPILTHQFDMVALPFSFRDAYHLLSGRPVRKRNYILPEGYTYKWYRLNLDAKGMGDPAEMLAYDDFKLIPLIKQLPCKECAPANRHMAIKALQQGELLYLPGPQGLVKVTVDPEQQGLTGLNDHLDPISFKNLLQQFSNHNGVTVTEVELPLRTPKSNAVRKFIKGFSQFNPFSKYRGRRS